MSVVKKLPLQSNLWKPLVELLDQRGVMTPKAVAGELATQLGLPPELREAEEKVGGKRCNLWERHVRWARQTLAARGYIADGRRGWWELTSEGKTHLKNCRPGVIVTVYETDLGVVMWADAQTAARSMEKESLKLIFTSPPYPLLRKKDYGNMDSIRHVEWLLDEAKTWRELLTDDGSLCLNLGDCWQRGIPSMDLYRERLLLGLCDKLGYHLAQTFYWENPCKMPNSTWVTIRRCRVNPSIEPIFWLSKSPWPSADNRRVLRPYSERMVKILAAGGEVRAKRPSGHGDSPTMFAVDHGGSIPHNLIVAHNAESSGKYFRYCRDHKLPIHPARFPLALPEFAIKLTTEPGDVVADFFAGSLKTAEACQKLGRRFRCSDQSLAYLQGGASNLISNAGFVDLTAGLFSKFE